MLTSQLSELQGDVRQRVHDDDSFVASGSSLTDFRCNHGSMFLLIPSRSPLILELL